MTTKAKPSPIAKFVLDFAPLLVFFAANKLAEIFVATLATMLVTLAVMLVSYFRYGRIQPMQWVVGVMVFVFGTATLVLHDPNFIKIKLTVIYLLFAGVLLFGRLTGRPLLKMAFGEAFPALDADGWRKLTRNWIVFCLSLAMMNEVLRRTLTTDQWVDFKVWGVTAITFIFALAQSPILSRHAEKPSAMGLPFAQGAILDVPFEIQHGRAEREALSALGLDTDADFAAIKSAYRMLAKVNHPDTTGFNPDAALRFKSIQTAYELLTRAENSRAQSGLRNTPSGAR